MGGAVLSAERDFAGYVSSYLGRYLPGQRNLSANTVASYRDMFKLLVSYFRELGKQPERMSMDDLSRESVEGFMAWLEGRGCADSTVNQRLSAVKAFANYAKALDPARMLQYQQVLAIRRRRKPSAQMVLPGRDGMAAILRSPDGSTRRGRRDMALLALLYDSAARVSELCGIALGDVRIDDPSVVTLTGKGRKTRVVPIMKSTAKLIEGYIKEAYPDAGSADAGSPLFPNPRGERLTRAAVTDIVARHVRGARESGAGVPEGVTPRSFRHQKAVDLLESGVPLIYIRDLLGHSSVKTTEIYATVSLARKRALLEQASTASNPREYPDWSDDEGLMSWLNGLC